MNLSRQDAELLWSDVVSTARSEAPDMLPWLERLVPCNMQDNTLVVSTKQNWTQRKVANELGREVERLLKEITLEDISLSVVLDAPGTAEDAGREPKPQLTELPSSSQEHVMPSVEKTVPKKPDVPQAKGLSPAAMAGLEMKARIEGNASDSRVVETAEEQSVPTTVDDAAPPTYAARLTGSLRDEPQSPQQPIPEEEPPSVATHPVGDFTFDNYVVGEANEIAYKMARAVAEQPGGVANPLFIYGPSGYGKTHLLLSIVDYVNRHTPGAYRTLYVDANAFVEQYVDDLRVKGIRGGEVMRAYRQADVLLVDDVQMFENKQESVSMLFDLFNMLIKDHKQIVLAADRAPDYLELDPRVKTRFGQGLVVDIKAPTYEMKRAILRSFYDRSPLRAISSVEITDETFAVIAEIGPENPREMQGLVTSLIPAASRNPSILTREGLRDFIGKLHRASRAIDIDAIAHAVSERFGVSVDAMRSTTRVKKVSEARQVVMWLTRQLTDTTYEQIGEYLGKRDHATVTYGIGAVEKRLADQGYSYMLAQLKQSIAE